MTKVTIDSSGNYEKKDEEEEPYVRENRTTGKTGPDIVCVI